MRKAIRVIAGILAVAVFCTGLGWGVLQLGKLYLSVIGNNTKLSEESATETGEKQLVKLPQFEVYYLQLGVFQDQANAEKLTNELQLAGVNAVVLRGKPNKVVAGYFGQLAAAKAAKAQITASNPIEKSLLVSGLAFKAAPGEAQKLGLALADYAGLLSKCAVVFKTANQAQITDKNLQEINAMLAKLDSDNGVLIKAISNENSKLPGKKTLTNLQEFSINFRQNLNAFSENKTLENYDRLQENCLLMLDCYVEYLQLLQAKPVN